MSHAEIWDDSALVNSWNDALEEYKQYHSISARGEKVEDILRHSDNQSKELSGVMDYEDEGANDLLGDDPHAKKNLTQETSEHAPKLHVEESHLEGERRVVTDQAIGTTSKGPELPQHLIGQVHDEGLKNLLMAWYYAGYYTGLNEGKQQGAAGKPEPTEK
ncbi:Survival motor neuron 1 [Hyphodiscus hymeniophilus]|uniref:Survival motor neuron 1 n=1 Tax=Hyphodiscus hymeniophilus TaxID=353542 RepID=A0A9P6VRE5_9HELO|nr:Survival motor neuron 1 [Hyphodiscus hymeniophilus]